MKLTRQFLIRSGVAVGATAVVVTAMLWLSGTFRRGGIKTGKFQPEATAGWGKRTVEVESLQRPYEAEVVGTIQAEVRTTISARITANILVMHKNAGDSVAKDEVVALLDDRDLKSRVVQGQQAILAAIAARDFAKGEVTRFASLPAGAVSQSERDEWQSKLIAAEADVMRSQESVREAQVALSFAKVTAPFDGVVVDRLVEPGEQASPGKPLLSMYDPSHLRLEANVREAYIGFLQAKKESKGPVSVFVDAIGPQRSGAVQQIVPTADPTSHSVLVRVTLSDSKGLYPGMFGRLRVPIGAEARLVIPVAAVRRIGQLTLVQVVEQGQPRQRSVLLGEIVDERYEVLAGLETGEQVVLPD